MRSEPAHLGGISLDFAGIPTKWNENLSYEHVQVGQPGKADRFFSKAHAYVLEFFPNSISNWLDEYYQISKT